MPSACWDPLSQVRLPLRVALVMIMIGITPLSAQVVINGAGVTITVAAGTQLVVEGGAQLNAAMVFENDGAVRVLGDWTNNSAGLGFYATSTGSVYLHSALPQNIQGTAVTDFRNLVISGGTKTLLRNAQCGTAAQPDGTLSLNSGVLLLNTRSFSLYNPASTSLVAVSGSVRSETIDLLGRFQWALGSDVTEHRIPFTDGSNNALPFAFTPSEAYPANTMLSVATYHTAPNNTPFPVTANQQVLNMAGASIADNSPYTVDRFWLTDLPNGSFTGTMRLSYAPLDDASLGPGAVRAQRWLESTGTWQYPPLPGQSNPATREVLVPNVVYTDATTPVNEHIWAMAYDNSPLPVELVHFAATCDGNAVRLRWTTATEMNSQHFVVQRSAGPDSWLTLGLVDAAGNSQQMIEYAYSAPLPTADGIFYYRLLQVDINGEETVLPMITGPSCGQPGSITFFPNPANDVLWIDASTLGSVDTDIVLVLVDAAGRTVARTTVGLPAPGTVALPLNHLASGCYIARAIGANGETLASDRIVKR